METIQRITQEETTTVVNNLKTNPSVDYLAIEEDLMRRIKIRVINANNASSRGDPKIQCPKYLNFGQVAEILNATMIIRVIEDGDSGTSILGVYNEAEGIYKTDRQELYQAATMMNNTLNKRDLDEMVSRLMLICEHVPINSNRDLIAVNNGIFDYQAKKVLPFDPKYVFLSKSAVDYVQNPVKPSFPDGWDVDAWLRDISVDDQVCRLLWETAGSVLRPYVKWNKTVWLFSTIGNNGKGTYCELLRNLLGNKSYTSIPLSDFSKEFALSPLIGKQAVITDENDVGTYIDKVGNLKAVVTGDVITINKKFEQPINYRFHGMMIQCLNEYPKVRDKSDSFYRRQIFVPFNKSFTGRENKAIKNEYLHDKRVLQYVMHKVLNMDYYSLSEPDACVHALDDYKEINDPIRQFWSEMEAEVAWDLVPYPFLFDLYKSWYEQNFPKDRQVAKLSFINSLKTIIQRESAIWECADDNNKKYRVGNKMSKPEPLIIQYELKKWESKTYTGRDPKRRCTLGPEDLAASYAGITRK